MKKFSVPFTLAVLTISSSLLSVQAIGRPVTTLAITTSPTVTTSTTITPTGGRGHLLGGKMVACQAHEQAIKTRSSHMATMAQNMETKFANIAQRVEQYYTDKELPAGKTVTNYSALVAAIQTQKTAVDTALTAVQTDATNFSCSSTDPKEQLTTYRQDMQKVIQALKDYRTSIKNLIVAVRGVAGTPEASESVTPTVSVSVSASPTVSVTQ